MSIQTEIDKLIMHGILAGESSDIAVKILSLFKSNLVEEKACLPCTTIYIKPEKDCPYCHGTGFTLRDIPIEKASEYTTAANVFIAKLWGNRYECDKTLIFIEDFWKKYGRVRVKGEK